MDATHVNTMMRHEVIDLLGSHDVGRLCVLDGDFPIAVPVNYRLQRDGGTDQIVIQTASTTTIGRTTGPASLEVDHIDLESGDVWSVLARGVLRRVDGDHQLPTTNPVVSAGRDLWLSLEILGVSGRRFRVGRRPPHSH